MTDRQNVETRRAERRAERERAERALALADARGATLSDQWAGAVAYAARTGANVARPVRRVERATPLQRATRARVIASLIAIPDSEDQSWYRAL